MFIDIPLGFVVLVVQKLCICIFLYILYWAVPSSSRLLYTADHIS
jgi:hypothetical protein